MGGANDGTVWGGWSNGLTISDPPAVAAGETITLGSAYIADIGFGASSTLGYAANSDHSGGTLSSAMVRTWPTSRSSAATWPRPLWPSDGYGGTLISEAAHASTQMPMVTQPHA